MAAILSNPVPAGNRHEAADVGLYKSLGGGWLTRREMAAAGEGR